MTWTKQTKAEAGTGSTSGWGDLAWGDDPWGGNTSTGWVNQDKESDSWTKQTKEEE